MKYRILILVFCSIAIYSQTKLNLNLELNESYEMFNHSEMSITQNLYNNEIRNYTELNGKTIYKVIEKTDSILTLEVEMAEVAIMMSSPYFKLYFDSKEQNNSNDIMTKMFSLLKNFKFIINITSQGEVYSSNFIEVFTTKFENLMDQIPDKVDTSKLGELKSKLNEMSPMKNLERLFLFFPKKEVSVGESWNVKGKSPIGFPIAFDRTVKLVSKDNDDIRLDSHSILTPYVIDKSKLMFENINFDLKGTEDHNLVLDDFSGWFKKVNGKMSLTGTMTFTTENGDTLKASTKISIKEYYGLKKY